MNTIASGSLTVLNALVILHQNQEVYSTVSRQLKSNNNTIDTRWYFY